MRAAFILRPSRWMPRAWRGGGEGKLRGPYRRPSFVLAPKVCWFFDLDLYNWFSFTDPISELFSERRERQKIFPTIRYVTLLQKGNFDIKKTKWYKDSNCLRHLPL
jgi:hypothetical protein